MKLVVFLAAIGLSGISFASFCTSRIEGELVERAWRSNAAFDFAQRPHADGLSMRLHVVVSKDISEEERELARKAANLAYDELVVRLKQNYSLSDQDIESNLEDVRLQLSKVADEPKNNMAYLLFQTRVSYWKSSDDKFSEYADIVVERQDAKSDYIVTRLALHEGRKSALDYGSAVSRFQPRILK